MFGFWKKKGGEVPEEQQWQKSAEQRAQERQQAAEIPQELRALGQDFLPEELTVLAVTGADPFTSGQEEGEGLRPASIGLTAWMEEDGAQIHQGDFRLEVLADDRLMEYLRQRVRKAPNRGRRSGSRPPRSPRSSGRWVRIFCRRS